MTRTQKEAASQSRRASRLVLCAAISPSADFSTRVAAAKSAGFDAITLSPQQYLNARNKEKLSNSEMHGILWDNDIGLDTVDPLLDWLGDHSSTSEQLVFEIADAFDAGAVNVAPAFAPDLSQGELTHAFARLCERAAQHGLRVDLEFLPWSVVPDYRVALDVIAGCEQDNAGLTLDCLHFYRSGGTPSDLAKLDPALAKRITNVQLCDIPKEPANLDFRQKLGANKEMLTSGRDGIRVMGFRRMIEVASKAHSTRPDASILMREATCSRLLPGKGDIPLEEIFRTLHALDVRPDIGLEIFSLEFGRLPVHDAASQAMAAYCELIESSAQRERDHEPS
jgi:sugar phosphate isomerase/epimerase